jgi:hypothetical protein
MKDRQKLNLLGKEYLTLDEASHYAGVSERQFRAKREEYGIFPIIFMGKVLYRRSDIAAAIEGEDITV